MVDLTAQKTDFLLADMLDGKWEMLKVERLGNLMVETTDTLSENLLVELAVPTLAVMKGL
jgi:hypothetical protein